MQSKLEAKYQVKTQLLGPGRQYNHQIEVLNRVVSWNGRKGIAYEAGPRHVELVVEQFGLQDAQIANTLGTREEGRTKDEHEEQLNERD